MKIGYITQWFEPERGSAAQASNIARSLVRQGLDVTVLTGFPNYPEGKVYPGYHVQPHQVEERDGMTVHRVPLVPTHRPDALSRIASYGSFAASATVAAPLLLADVEATLVHLTPTPPAAAAHMLQRTRGIPFVLHVQDLWPDTVTSSGFLSGGRARIVEPPLHRFCDRMYRAAHSIAVTSPGMKDKIAARGINPTKIHLAANWADEGAFRPMPADLDERARLGLRPFTVMYAGNLGEFQALDVLLDVAARTRDLTHVGYAIVGEGVRLESLRSRVADEGLDNVTFVPAQPFDQMSRMLALGDLHFVGLADLPLFGLTLPSKLQATLSVGKPILGSLRGDAAAVIEQSGAGACCAPGDIDGLETVVRRYAADPELTREAGRRARTYYEGTFSEAHSSAILSGLLRAAASSRSTTQEVAR